jgi:uncharacterized protein (TIGR00162 family)
MECKIILLKKPNLKDPIMIAGLPGFGYVGKLSADYLIEKLNAELFGELYSPFFPPYVLVKEDGLVELMKNEFYFVKNINNLDLIIFTGNTQAISSEGQYDVVEKTLELAKDFNVKKLFTMAAYISESYNEERKVYGVASSIKLIEELKKYNVEIMKEGSISGINGLLFGLAKTRNIESICLLGETPSYIIPSGRMIADPKASKAILSILANILGISLDLKGLEKQAQYMEEIIRKIEEIERKAIEEATKGKKERVGYIG